MQITPFIPDPLSTTQLSANTASTTATVRNVAISGSYRARVYNSGPNDAAIENGNTSCTATFPSSTASGASMVLAAGNTEVFTFRSGTLAGICTGSGATAVLYITPGDGI